MSMGGDSEDKGGYQYKDEGEGGDGGEGGVQGEGEDQGEGKDDCSPSGSPSRCPRDP